VHYLCVSGAHVGMLVGAVWSIGWLFGARRRQCAGWAILVATGYAILAESSAPIVRAAIMTDLACLAVLMRRPVRVANCLAISALILLVIRPTQVFNAGFQLSYITLFAVIYVSPRVYHSCSQMYRRLAGRDDPLLRPEMQQRLGMRSPRWAYWDKAVRVAGWPLAVGVSAAAVGAMLSACHFHRIQCWGWLNTVVLMPLIWIIMLLGMFKTLAGTIAPWLAVPLGWLLAKLADVLILLVEAMARFPVASFTTPDVPPLLVAFGLVVVLLWTVEPALRIPTPCSRLAALALVVAAAWSLASPGPRQSLVVHVLAVGSGSTTVVQLPNGKTVIYDLGSSPPYDLERWTLGPVLSRERCWRVDAVILSHADLDHYAGLADLIDRRWVARVITTPQFEHDAQAYSSSRDLIARLSEKAILWHKASRGDRITNSGDAVLEVLWPPAGLAATGNSNDTSLVLRISYAGKRVLACGDIEEYAIQQLLATTDVRADVLLLPHHGSMTPSTAAFIRAVDPRYCIRSTGRRETSEALRQAVASREYLSTAVNGAIEVRVEPERLQVLPRFATAGQMTSEPD
jgi:competence protein ComEC